MNRHRFLSVLALSMFLVISCGDDDSNPVDGGGGGGDSASKGSLTAHSGANAPVTESNAPQVTAEINAKAWTVFGQAMSTMKYGKIAAGTTMNLDGKVNGTKSGYAQVKGTVNLSQSGATVSAYTYNFTCTFYDYSDDALSWLGGAITYTGNYDLTNTSSPKYDITMKGGLRFNGKYDGTQEFTTKYTMNGQSVSWNTTSTITSGGKTFTNTSKYPL